MKPKIHDVIRHTIKQISEYTLRTFPEKKTRDMFYAIYEIAAQQFANGKLEIIPKMINQDDPKKHSIVLPQYENIKSPKEAMQAIMKQLRGGLK